jgi:DNA-binding transcriptional ArsR family regulator
VTDVGAVFAALADPTRRQVIRSLSGAEPVTASGLAAELPITRQAIAKHLGALERAGLVEPHKEGRETRYRLTPAPLDDAIAWMEEVGARWDRSLARLSERARRA